MPLLSLDGVYKTRDPYKIGGRIRGTLGDLDPLNKVPV